MSGRVDARFPGFSAVGQSQHWDAATRAVVLARLRTPGRPRFFSDRELGTLTALIGRLVDVDDDLARSLAGSVDARIADEETDGWHYDDMPPDDEVWRRSLAGLDEDAAARDGAAFAALTVTTRHDVLAAIDQGDAPTWHDLPRKHVWNLWMRYACTAYYAHPTAWDEMGWAGPAYPRGYKHIGVDAREPFEVADREPQQDPTRSVRTA